MHRNKLKRKRGQNKYKKRRKQKSLLIFWRLYKGGYYFICLIFLIFFQKVTQRNLYCICWCRKIVKHI